MANGDTAVPAFAGYSREIGVDGVGQFSGAGIRGSSNAGGGVDFNGAGTGVEGRSGSGIGVSGQSTSFVGVYGLSTSLYGVYGESSSGSGVYGESSSGSGVFGQSGNSGPTTNTQAGVHGTAQSTNGVVGTSTSATGVYGISGGTGPGLGAPFGVVGTSVNNGGVFGTSTNNIGVRGLSTNQIGVRGDSTSNYGVYGASGTNTGVYGVSSTGFGVYGISSATALRGEALGGGVAFVGVAHNPGAGGKAGQFVGDVLIQGALTVTGSYPKSAAVKHPDGSHRRVYCQEATEAWFEDFGTATLTNGRAVVDLDPDFDAVVKGDDYLVFTMPEGDCNGLYISRKGPHRFVVEQLKGGKSNLPFSYRVVSRRRDNVGKRLEKVDVSPPPTPKDRPRPPEPIEIPPTPARPPQDDGRAR